MTSSKNSPPPNSETTNEPTNALTTLPSPLAQTIIWLLEGNRNEDIAQQITLVYPKENAAELLKAAAAHFEIVAQADVEVIRGWCLEAMREMYRRMVSIGDYTGALRAVKELMAYTKQCSPAQPNNEPTPPTVEEPTAA